MNNFPDKNEIKKTDAPDLPENESVMPENNVVNEEEDLDELVHNTKPNSVSTDEETDLDDAVHKITPVMNAPENEERDGDDLVHGN